MPPEMYLWRAVILEALWTACSREEVFDPTKYKTAGTRKDGKYRIGLENLERQTCRRWLLGHCKDFVTVCTLAGWHPGYIRDRVRALADAGWPSFVEEKPDFAAICAQNDNADLEEVA